MTRQRSSLTERLKAGDPKAVREWFAKYHPLVLKLAKIRISDQKDAQDVAQETMINALRQIQVFREESSLRTWMTSILRHEIADYYRKKYAKKALQVVPLGERLLASNIRDSSEVQQAVRRVLGQMAEQRKLLLLMKYVDGLKVKEIARKLGKTFKSVEAELYRAREGFKKKYAKEARVAKW